MRLKYNKNDPFSFKEAIPYTVKKEINHVVNGTQKTGKEQSLTWCRVKNTNEIFVSNQATGTQNSTETKPCSRQDGDTEQIGDLHTHPTQNSDTIGITPSTSDIVSTLVESVDKGIPQISCITGPGSKFLGCYQPKPGILRDQYKIQAYDQTLEYNESTPNDVAPYIKQNVRQDFDHAIYDRKTLKRVYNPNPKDIVNDALMKSKKYLKENITSDQDKISFCNIIEDLIHPTKNRSVTQECIRQLL